MFTVDVKQQYNKSLRLMSGANFPPIVAWNLPATSGFLNLSRSTLSLDWVGFFVFFRRTRKVIITRTRGYKIEWSSACSSFVRFMLNFMLNIEHENVLKSFITSGLCSDQELCSLEPENVLKKFYNLGARSWSLPMSAPGKLLVLLTLTPDRS